MVLLEFSMAPTGQGESLSPYVARIIDIVDRSGLPYQLTPMGTIIEGEWEQAMAVVSECFHELRADCNRIGAHIKIDYRAGPAGRMQSKVCAIEEQLGRKIST